MKQTDVLIIGGGPAGLCAAINAARANLSVWLVERDDELGGQLIKQTHMFFGSKKQYASTRGVDIATTLKEKVTGFDNVKLFTGTTVLGLYEDGVVTMMDRDRYFKVKPRAVICATGASEKYLQFPNNDLPGIYGAGAVQTLMNVYGVKPGQRVLMVGAGNIGLIVAYQLKQAGVEVVCVVEAAPQIGGYLVHASKIRRLGIPILTRHTIKEAFGRETLEGATLVRLDDQWQPVPGSETKVKVDVICISVGLSALTELLWQAGCDMVYESTLGGFVPKRDLSLMTSKPGLFVAGDIAGIEEASSAMVEGYLAGLSAAQWIGSPLEDSDVIRRDLIKQLQSLRAGPEGRALQEALLKVSLSPAEEPELTQNSTSFQDALPPGSLEKEGIPSEEEAASLLPETARLESGPVAVVECFREIPCDPCYDACPQGAFAPFEDINDVPALDHDACTGCGLCLSRCPGLAIRIVDMNWSKDKSLIQIPYEFSPLPAEGEVGLALDRRGQPLGEGKVEKILDRDTFDRTPLLSLSVDKEHALEVLFYRPGEKKEDLDDKTIVCRCSDVTLGDIRKMIQQGCTTIEELKRLTRIGMGPCQGKTCTPLLLKELSAHTGQSIESLRPGTLRPPSVGISLSHLKEAAERGEDE